MKILRFLPALLPILLAACSTGSAPNLADFHPVYTPKYASGFTILGADGLQSTIIETKTPWQGADSTAATRLFIARGGEKVPEGFKGSVLRGDASRVICMSTSYIAMLHAVGNTSKIVGVSGLPYVINPAIRARRDSIADVGYDRNFDYELVLSLSPDLVLLYGVNGVSAIEPKLTELGIPYMYVGEYLEEHPLGKAEWIVAINEPLGNRSKAVDAFSEIPREYNALRHLVDTVARRPMVMLNTPYRDSWVIPSAKSYFSRLVTDAGGRIPALGNNSNSSLPVDIEEAYRLTDRADVWINVGRCTSLEGLTQILPKFADTAPVVNHQVWNSTLRATPGGGNDFWESGVVYPHLILQDLIKIFHPNLLNDRPFTYYEQLR